MYYFHSRSANDSQFSQWSSDTELFPSALVCHPPTLSTVPTAGGISSVSHLVFFEVRTLFATRILPRTWWRGGVPASPRRSCLVRSFARCRRTRPGQACSPAGARPSGHIGPPASQAPSPLTADDRRHQASDDSRRICVQIVENLIFYDAHDVTSSVQNKITFRGRNDNINQTTHTTPGND